MSVSIEFHKCERCGESYMFSEKLHELLCDNILQAKTDREEFWSLLADTKQKLEEQQRMCGHVDWLILRTIDLIERAAKLR